MKLSLIDVHAGYGRTDVLHGLTAHFEAGGKYCLLGANGCGKTTLLRAIAGLIPHTGRILLDEQELSSMRRLDIASRIAVMSQISHSSYGYSVYDTVMLGRYQQTRRNLWNRPRKEDRERVEECLALMDLSSLKDHSIDTLSGGQRQRVFLAQVLAQEPEIILLDEPTNHLDIKYQLELLEALDAWTKDGRHTVIAVLHDINLALHFTHRVLLMQEGRLAANGDITHPSVASVLNSIYGMDIAEYMRASLNNWESIPTCI